MAFAVMLRSHGMPLPAIVTYGEYTAFSLFKMTLTSYIKALEARGRSNHEWGQDVGGTSVLFRCMLARFRPIDDWGATSSVHPPRGPFFNSKERLPDARSLCDEITVLLGAFHATHQHAWRTVQRFEGRFHIEAIADAQRSLGATVSLLKHVYTVISSRLAKFAHFVSEEPPHMHMAHIWRELNNMLIDVHTVYYEVGLRTPPSHDDLVRQLANEVMVTTPGEERELIFANDTAREWTVTRAREAGAIVILALQKQRDWEGSGARRSAAAHIGADPAVHVAGYVGDEDDPDLEAEQAGERRRAAQEAQREEAAQELREARGKRRGFMNALSG